MQLLRKVPEGEGGTVKLVVRAQLRSPYGNICEHYIDPSGHPVRRGIKVAFTGARDLWTVLAVDVPSQLPKGHDCWTVTKVVE